MHALVLAQVVPVHVPVEEGKLPLIMVDGEYII